MHQTMTMAEFLDLLSSEKINQVDLWWGEGNRVGMMNGKIIIVPEFHLEGLVHFLEKKLGGQAVGPSSVELTVELFESLTREVWFQRILDPETRRDRILSGRLGQIGPVMICCQPLEDLTPSMLQ